MTFDCTQRHGTSQLAAASAASSLKLDRTTLELASRRRRKLTNEIAVILGIT
jgi:hypothetical protein